MDPVLHRKYTGVPNEEILGNLEWLAENRFETIVRIPVIPGINDTEDNIVSAGRFLSSLAVRPSVNLLAYHASALEKYRRIDMAYRLDGISSPPGDHMRDISDRLGMFGLNVSIGG